GVGTGDHPAAKRIRRRLDRCGAGGHHRPRDGRACFRPATLPVALSRPWSPGRHRGITQSIPGPARRSSPALGFEGGVRSRTRRRRAGNYRLGRSSPDARPNAVTSVRLLAFAASLRRGALNRRLLTAAVELARADGAAVDVAEFAEFEMPLFNHDVLEAAGLPPGAQELARRILAADGLLIASPEYNYSLPGTLKNAIDWVSRMKPMPFRGKSAFLVAASGGLIGGIRGLWQLRI